MVFIGTIYDSPGFNNLKNEIDSSQLLGKVDFSILDPTRILSGNVQFNADKIKKNKNEIKNELLKANNIEDKEDIDEEQYVPDDQDIIALTLTHNATANEKRDAVRAEFLHAWHGYTKYAFGFDELLPVTKEGRNTYGMGLTIIDSLDTLILMQADSDYERSLKWIIESLRFDFQEDVNVFEVTIRVVGGLLGAYTLREHPVFLERAQDLVNRMIIAFDSPTFLPYGTIGFQSGKTYNPDWANGASTVSEVGTLQLEFSYLSRLTGDSRFADITDNIHVLLSNLNVSLYNQMISVTTGELLSKTPISFGARVDSLYEYFLKHYVFSGQKKRLPLTMYQQSMKAMIEDLLAVSAVDNLIFITEIHFTDNSTYHAAKMDHLVCFVPGMLTLGVYFDVVEKNVAKVHMLLAEELMKTCYEVYKRSPTGIAPEIIFFTGAKRLITTKSEDVENEDVENENVENEDIEKEGIEEEGIEKEGIEKEGIEKEGIEKESEKGVEKEGIEKEGVEKKGIEKKGVEKKGIEKEGIEKEGIEKEGIEKEGIEKEGIEKEGIEKEGIEKEGIEKEGIEKEGIEKEGIEKESTKESVEKEGVEKYKQKEHKEHKEYKEYEHEEHEEHEESNEYEQYGLEEHEEYDERDGLEAKQLITTKREIEKEGIGKKNIEKGVEQDIEKYKHKEHKEYEKHEEQDKYKEHEQYEEREHKKKKEENSRSLSEVEGAEEEHKEYEEKEKEESIEKENQKNNEDEEVSSDKINTDFVMLDSSSHSHLRPETVESLFVLYRVTHDPKYREWGWEIFQSIVWYGRVPSGGYSGLKDVRKTTRKKNQKLWSNWDNHMDSFVLAETFKYLYLLFSEDDIIPIDKYTFNTEAHPFRIVRTDDMK